MRFEQHGSSCRLWVAPEVKDPVLLHHPTSKGVGYFGAVRLRDGKLVRRRESKTFNGETFFDFLKDLRRRCCRSGRRAIVILDNNKFHHACLHKPWREQCEHRFALEFMPPYSPQLNPIERVWKLTRRQATHNRYFPTLEALIQAVENTFAEWQNGNKTLQCLCAI